MKKNMIRFIYVIGYGDFMNNRGFTLIELLAVLVVLGGVSLVVVLGITSSLERQDENTLNNQISLVKNAGKIYFSLNNSSCVSIYTLTNGNYIEADKISKINNNGNSCICINNNKYEYCKNCDCNTSIYNECS